MALFYFKCDKCGAQSRRVFSPEKAEEFAGSACIFSKDRPCGGKMKRDPRPPTTSVKERIDNGSMVRRVETYTDATEIYSKRSKEDPRLKPDRYVGDPEDVI